MNINEIFAPLPEWEVEEITGYTPITTYWQDFSIAEYCELKFNEIGAIKNTHELIWSTLTDMELGIEFFTEYVLVLNWKSWYHKVSLNHELTSVYWDLFVECDKWAVDNLSKEQMEYYISVTEH